MKYTINVPDTSTNYNLVINAVFSYLETTTGSNFLFNLMHGKMSMEQIMDLVGKQEAKIYRPMFGRRSLAGADPYYLDRLHRISRLLYRVSAKCLKSSTGA